MDRRGVAAIEQGHDGVDRGQAGADQQDRIVRTQARQGVGRPGVGAVVAAVVEGRGFDRRRLGREVAEGQDREVGGEGAVAVEDQAHRTLVAVDVEHLAADQVETVAEAGTAELLVEQVADIGAELAAGDEGVGFWTPGVAVVAFAQPRDEMVGAVVERAHPAGGDVEQMAGVGGAVGLAAAEAAVAFDERDAGPGRGGAQEVQGDEGAAEAGADDRDGGWGQGQRLRRQTLPRAPVPGGVQGQSPCPFKIWPA